MLCEKRLAAYDPRNLVEKGFLCTVSLISDRASRSCGQMADEVKLNNMVWIPAQDPLGQHPFIRGWGCSHAMLMCLLCIIHKELVFLCGGGSHISNGF